LKITPPPHRSDGNSRLALWPRLYSPLRECRFQRSDIDIEKLQPIWRGTPEDGTEMPIAQLRYDGISTFTVRSAEGRLLLHSTGFIRPG
jgi:hypothetical protein